MDIRKVKKLIELLDESGISEIEITEGDESVRISRNAPSVAAPAPTYVTPAFAAPVSEASPAAPPAAAAAPTAADDSDGYEVTAPMVGTFYAASSPGSPPFVQVRLRSAHYG